MWKKYKTDIIVVGLFLGSFFVMAYWEQISLIGLFFIKGFGDPEFWIELVPELIGFVVLCAIVAYIKGPSKEEIADEVIKKIKQEV